jgi:20S proteasome alpha/beta subunit
LLRQKIIGLQGSFKYQEYDIGSYIGVCMTIIVALNCKDGFVVASDTQVSEGAVRKLNHQKVFPISDNVIFASSGTVGFKQKYLEVIQASKEVLEGELNVKARHTILDALSNVTHETWQIWKRANPGRSVDGSSENYPTQADVLLCVMEPMGARKIWHITGECLDEISQEPYACSGSGSDFAHAILVRHDSKYSRIPEMEIYKATLVAYKTVRETIDVSSGGVGGPVDIWIMTREGVRQLGSIELSALDQAYSELSKREAGLWGDVQHKSQASSEGSGMNMTEFLRRNVALPVAKKHKIKMKTA